MAKRLIPAVLLLTGLTLIGTATHAAASCQHDPAHGRPKVGLALGGGGARGYAHIGVLRGLEELRIPIDYVAGTSIGSITAGMLAAGLTASEIETVAAGIDWNAMFADATDRSDRPFRRKLDDDLALFGPKIGIGPGASVLPRGAISGQKILFLFESVINEQIQHRDFDTLPIPFRAVAADLGDGSEVVLGAGSVAVAMRASMSVPAVFDPVPFEGRQLVDGGIANNLPVSVVRGMGADTVIAVDVGSGLLDSNEINDVLSVAEQLTNILVENTTTYQKSLLTAEDRLIQPALGDEVGAADFDAIDAGIRIGYEAVAAMAGELAQLGLSEDDYRQHRAYVEACVTGPPVIDWIELDNQSRFRDTIIARRLDVELGVPLDLQRLDASLKEIYALGFLRTARYEIRERDGSTGLYVQVLEDGRGGDLIEYGLDVFGQGGSADFNLRIGYLKTDLDDTGAEFRALAQVGTDEGLLLEFYKPFGDELRYVLVPQATYERRVFNEYDALGNRLNQFDVQLSGLSVGLGREFSRHGAVFVGARAFRGQADIVVGDPAVPDLEFDGGEWFVAAQYDRLDDPFFPQRGSAIALNYRRSSERLGAEVPYEQVVAEGFKAWTRGRHNLILGAIFETTLDDDAPVYAQFRGGGFFRLSGFDDNEITGQHFGMLGGAYRFQLDSGGLLPAYVGGSLEYGNVAERRPEVWGDALLHGSLYLGFDSPIGPLYAGVGLGESDRRQFFVRLGNIFGSSSIGR